MDKSGKMSKMVVKYGKQGDVIPSSTIEFTFQGTEYEVRYLTRIINEKLAELSGGDQK